LQTKREYSTKDFINENVQTIKETLGTKGLPERI